jgi:hypothetical protein
LEGYRDTGGEKVWRKHRHSDSQVCIHSIFEFLCSSFDDFFSFSESITSSADRFELFGWVFCKREFLNLLFCGGFDDAVDVDARDVDLRGIKFAWFDDFFCFYDGDFGVSGHCAVKVVCGETENTVSYTNKSIVIEIEGYHVCRLCML